MDMETTGELLALKVLAVRILAALINRESDPIAFLDAMERQIIEDISRATVEEASSNDAATTRRNAARNIRQLFGALTVTATSTR